MELCNIYSIEIDGISVPEYCVIHNIPFNDVNKRFIRMQNNKSLEKKLEKWAGSDLVKYIIKEFHKKKCGSQFEVKYLDGNDEIFEEARKNKIMTANVKGAIHRGLRRNPNASAKEIAPSFIERRKKSIKYTCNQEPLKDVCFDLDLNPATVRIIFRDQFPEEVRDYMTPDEVDTAVTDIVYSLAVRKANRRKK